MPKPLNTLALGDWVVTDSALSSRFVGEPWKVTKVASSRVYLERWRPHPRTGVLELADSKYVALKSVRYAFSTEAAAKAVSEFAAKAAREYEQELKALQARHQQAFDTFLAGLPGSRGVGTPP